MRSVLKIIIMATITFGSVAILYAFNPILEDIFDEEEEERIFIDSLGREVEIPEHPERIISMSPTITEILYELEVDDRLVGVTKYCNYPKDAQSKTKIGGYTTPNLEIIISLEPDLVICDRDDPEVIEYLEEYDIAIVVVFADTLHEGIERIEDIGWMVDAEDEADEVCGIMMYKINYVTSKTDTLSKSEKLKCYFELWETPTVAGGGSFIDDMITKAGGINIFGDIDEKYPDVSDSDVISGQPEVIFVVAMGRQYYEEDISERYKDDGVPAVENDRIYECDDDIYTRNGPRVVDGLEEMAYYLYPSLFD